MLDSRGSVLNLVRLLLYNKFLSDLHSSPCNIRIALTFVIKTYVYLNLMFISKKSIFFLGGYKVL